MGDKKEEDIQVKVSIPELGITARDYIDELIPENANEEDEESSDQVDLFFRIPKGAESKDYNVNVELIYNRGHTTISESYLIHVNGEGASASEGSVVSVDSVSKDVAQGSTVAYKVMVANFGKQKAVYSAEVLGVGVWGTASVEPGFVSVNAGETGELLVKVTPNSNTVGTQGFTVKVKSNGGTLKEIGMSEERYEEAKRISEEKEAKKKGK